MKNTQYIIEQYAKNKDAYFLNEYEGIAVRFTSLSDTTSACYAKQKGKNEYKIDQSESLAMDIEASGKIITKTKYDKY